MYSTEFTQGHAVTRKSYRQLLCVLPLKQEMWSTASQSRSKMTKLID